MGRLALQRGLDEGFEQRMAGARRRGEFGVELHADEPGMHGLRQFHDLGQILARRARRDDQPGFFQFRHVMVVDFIAVAMALVDFIAVDALRPSCRA